MMADGVMHQVDGYWFGTHLMGGFWTYCQNRGLSQPDVKKLNPKEKSKLVLRWKWHTDDYVSAGECERSRQDVLSTLKRMPPTAEGDAYWYSNALELEKVCSDIKAELGIGPMAQPDWKRKDIND